MADYHLEGPKPARIYEVILPKKLGYFGKIQEVLEDLFNEQAIRNIPFVQQSIDRQHRQDGSFDEEGWIRTLCHASRGYSIYEMDGRYLSPPGPVNERVLVIRFIFHNPPDRPAIPAPTSSRRHWRWSTTSWPSDSPTSWGWRKRSGSWNTTRRGWRSGGASLPTLLARENLAEFGLPIGMARPRSRYRDLHSR